MVHDMNLLDDVRILDDRLWARECVCPFKIDFIMINVESFPSEVSDNQDGRFGGTFLSPVSHSSAGSHQICRGLARQRKPCWREEI